MKNKKISVHFDLILLLFAAAFFLVACSTAGGGEPAVDEETRETMDGEEMDHEDEDMAETDHEEEMNHDDDHDHDDSEVMRIPNEGGAAITIISPEEGDTFSTLDQVIIDVAVENFELGVDGSHWHVYVDGTSFGMVMGGNTDQALPGLDPGEHEISVHLAIGTHEEYEDGDAVTIVVEERE